MHLEAKSSNEFQCDFSIEEIRAVHQAFNEICYGFAVPDFGKRIGDMDVVKTEMNKLSETYNNQGKNGKTIIHIRLNFAQMEIYPKIISAVCEEIEDWEFETRMGISKSKAQQLVVSFLNGMARQPFVPR